MKVFNQNQEGYTLLEIIVAVTIFMVIIISTSTIFISVSQVQQLTIASQANLDNVRYFMEVISKEIRQATRSNDDCDVIYGALGYDEDNQIFRTRNSGTEFYFKNKFGECVKYSLVDEVMVRDTEYSGSSVKASSTPAKLIISNLNFDVTDNDASSPGADLQPKVTISFDVKYDSVRDEYKKPLRIQTTISSRNYRN